MRETKFAKKFLQCTLVVFGAVVSVAVVAVFVLVVVGVVGVDIKEYLLSLSAIIKEKI